MHEFTITTSIVKSVLELARKQGATRVVEVRLRIGRLRALSVEQLRFSYEILSKGNMLEQSKLQIEESPGFVRCEQCGYHNEFNPDQPDAYHFALPMLLCPRCQSAVTVEGGDECVITKVRMIAPTGGRS